MRKAEWEDRELTSSHRQTRTTTTSRTSISKNWRLTEKISHTTKDIKKIHTEMGRRRRDTV